MAGFDVSQGLINQKAGEAALALREAFDAVHQMRLWLADHPGYDQTSPLVDVFGFTPDEAYLVQTAFQELDTLRAAGAEALDLARKLTGLQ